MGGGFLSGAIWGFIFSAVMLIGVSLSTPLPPRDGHGAGTVQDATAVASETADAAAAQAPAEPVDTETNAGTGSEPAAVQPDAAPTPEETATEATAPAESVPLPSASEFNRPPPERIANLPQADAPPAASTPAPPAADPAGTSASPSPDTAPAPQPDIAATPQQPVTAAPAIAPSPQLATVTDRAAGGTSPERLSPPQVADAPSGTDLSPAPPPAPPVPVPAVEPQEPTPQTPQTVAEPAVEPAVEAAAEPAPVRVEPDTETSIATEPEPEPEAAPETATAALAVPPQTPTPSFPVLPDTGTAPDTASVPAEPRLPRVTVPADTPTPRLPQVAGAAVSGIGVGTGNGQARLPQVGNTPMADSPSDSVSAVAPEAVPAAPDAAPNALRDNAEPFEASDDRALLGIVLIDEPDSGLDPAILTRFSFPVAIAIDPMRPDAASRARELRAAGLEVIILGETVIPEGATPTDLEVGLAVARDTVPVAIAVMDGPESRIQADRPILDATVAALSETGHGLLAFPRGLNAAEETARRNDLPAATFFRQLDDEDQRATVITRYLGRAAFAAVQEGGAVVVGRTRPDTVTALFSWALGSRSEAVMIAPVSAVLQRLSE
jgi:polysaccharide deacetylase 2 family uncharacterized protein YibQ